MVMSIVTQRAMNTHIMERSYTLLENPVNELIEVQVGSYLGEDDIVRFDDIYGA